MCAFCSIQVSFLKHLETDVLLRRLRLSVNWAMSVPAFQVLASADQQILLDDSLLELLVLTALQYKGGAGAEGVQLLLSQHCSNLSDQYKLKDIIKYVDSLNLDQIEYTSLKALLLFRPGEFCVASNEMKAA